MSNFRPAPPSADGWAKSDAFFAGHLLPEDPVLEAAIQNSHNNGLPQIAVSPLQGKYLKLLAQSLGAKRILEVGTLGGYSTIWFARALPADGKIITLELIEKHAKVAKQNLDKAGLLSKVDIKVGPAADSLKGLSADEPFDLVFIDADFQGVPTYFKEAKRLTKKGAVIIVDNVNWQGTVALEPENTQSADVKETRKFFQQLKNDKDVDATALNLTGVKGFDGMLYAVKL